MRKIDFKGLDLSAYYEKLENGLDIIMIPYNDKKNYFMSYTTKFGSEITSFFDNIKKEKVVVPDGIAHFLEHKMFEQEDGVDPFKFFSESGTGSNAGTYYDYTDYICYGTKEFEKNLEFLLEYVSLPYYTDENVLKEKGIIAEELKMYADSPGYKLEQLLKEAVYKKHPRRIDIGGTLESIEKITKEDLYKCYDNFYVPNNMFVLLVGNFDKDKALKIIKKKLEGKESRRLPDIKEIDEPITVNKKEDLGRANIKIPRIGIGLKVAAKELEKFDKLTLDMYLQMIASLTFGSTSLFRENARNKKILDGMQFMWETIPHIKTLFIMATSKEPDELINAIKKEISNLDIKEEDVERMKKVWIANEVTVADYINNFRDEIFDDFIRYGEIIPNKLDEIRKLNLKDIKEIISLIDPDNISVVKLLPEESLD